MIADRAISPTTAAQPDFREPETLAWCRRCGADTRTELVPLRCGHIGRLCVVCRSLRHPRPFASKAEFANLANPPAPHVAAEGAHASASR